jgi:hypothetical protein
VAMALASRPHAFCNDKFGNLSMEIKAINGDNRGAFLSDNHGEKSHHLYLWHLSNMMGILKNVLCVLSAEVAADTHGIPAGLSQTQKK